MRLESPLLLLVALPTLACLFYGLWKARFRPSVLRFPSLEVIDRARPPILSRLHLLPRLLEALGVLLALFALARPQVEDPGEVVTEGSDFVLVLDMSGSMNAVDMEPEKILEYHARGQEPPNRFETARHILERFITSHPHDRIGLIIFSSKAWVKFPLTLDQDAMLRILRSLVLDDGVRGQDPNVCLNGCTITGEATAIGDALGRAYKRLEASEARSRNIILITDGDNNAGSANPEEVAKFIAEETKDRPIRIYTFLVGTGQNTYVPARNPFTGQPILTAQGLKVYERPKEPFPVNPELLKKIASATGGSYHEAATLHEFEQEFETLEKTAFRSKGLTAWRDVYVWPAAFAFGLVFLGEFLSLTVFRRWPL